MMMEEWLEVGAFSAHEWLRNLEERFELCVPSAPKRLGNWDPEFAHRPDVLEAARHAFECRPRDFQLPRGSVEEC